MDLKQRTVLVDRILSGIIYRNVKGELYKLIPPNRDQRALAAMVYRDIVNEVKFDDLITREQMAVFLHRKGIWTPQHEDRMKQLEKQLDDLKLKLYKSAYSDKDRKSVRRNIKNTREAIEKLFFTKNSLDNMTREYHAENIKDDFLKAICIYTEDNKQVYTYKNFWCSDSEILNSFLYYMNSSILNSSEYREIVRTDPFRSLWAIGKTKTFGVDLAPSDMTFEQRNLILYSKMYDNVYEHPERPSDTVVEDDDMLDGWFIQQQRESEKERKQKEVEKILGKKTGKGHADADETFVVTGSAEEAEKIRELNDLNARMAMKQRDQTLSQRGKVEDKDLPDVKLGLRNRALQQMAEKVKGK